MNYTIYDSATGQIIQTLTSADQEIINENLQGKTFVEGLFDGKMYYIKDQIAIRFPPRPTNDLIYYEWDWIQHAWFVNTQITAQQMRQHRDNLLSVLDRVNPIWYNSLDINQQQQLQAYRQALLDVPQQEGFPGQVEWPTKPQWL